ncbi:ABC transporter-like protein [Sesbania bispinosa]|nr:ABC transporter-like protein [Sesbania bispinosa]
MPILQGPEWHGHTGPFGSMMLTGRRYATEGGGICSSTALLVIAVAPLPFRNPLKLTFYDTQAVLNLLWRILRMKNRNLEEEEPKNEPVAKPDDVVVLDVGSGGPEDP